jgi:hypothetical protein
VSHPINICHHPTGHATHSTDPVSQNINLLRHSMEWKHLAGKSLRGK